MNLHEDTVSMIEAKYDYQLVTCPRCWISLPAKQFRVLIAKKMGPRVWPFRLKDYREIWVAKCEGCRNGRI